MSSGDIGRSRFSSVVCTARRYFGIRGLLSCWRIERRLHPRNERISNARLFGVRYLGALVEAAHHPAEDDLLGRLVDPEDVAPRIREHEPPAARILVQLGVDPTAGVQDA